MREVEAVCGRICEEPEVSVGMREVECFVGTYNVNGKREKAIALSWWLMQGWSELAPHVFAVTLQEMIDLSAANVVKEAIADTRSRTASEEWASELRRAFGYISAARPDAFGGRGLPTLIAEEHMVGVAIFVFAWDRVDGFLGAIGDGGGARLPTGAVGGRLGNKGACAVRFRLWSSTLCFVGAHLSAHRGDVAGRNSDYRAIVEKDCFSRADASWRGGGYDRPPSSGLSPSFDKIQGGARWPSNPCRLEFGVLDHDVVVFAGDLNYRIAADVPDKEVQYLLRSDVAKLAAMDQLNVERAAGRAFQHGFVEANIAHFLPTYRYVAGTSLYDYEAAASNVDGAAGKKVRCPAWCDRVLWRAAPQGPRPRDAAFAEGVGLAAYDRADDRLCVSDHRPVSALLRLKLRDVDARERDVSGHVHAAEARGRRAPKPFKGPAADEQKRGFEVLTRPASLSLSAAPPPPSKPGAPPRLAVDPPVLWLRAGVDAVATVANGGDAPVDLRFVGVPDWLRLSPPQTLLAPGDAAPIKAHAALDGAHKAELADHDGLLAATVSLVVDGATTHLLPVVVSSGPDWPNGKEPQRRPSPAPVRAASILTLPGGI